jgi:hypothetical protein
MVAVVAAETLLLVLLVVLVAGLLRSHAEILRRLAAVEHGDSAARLAPPAPRQRTGAELDAAALTGVTPSGDAVALAFDGPGSRPTLLAFLTSGCTSCAGFWETLAERRLPPEVQTVIVTHGAERERPVRLRELAPTGVPVVMSSQAWTDYAVPGSPYFVLVDGLVRGEGMATSWSALASLVGDALADERNATKRPAGERRARDIDATLAAAGIGPGHESLYPGGHPAEQ